MKQILIINGSGGAGKDTFVDYLNEYIPVCHESIITPVKNLAYKIGWTGEKDEKSRKFLCNLKKLIDEYNDNNYSTVAKSMKNFLDDDTKTGLFCIDMRESEQIKRAKEEFNAKTVLIVRDNIKHITSNTADAGVFDMNYDYTIENNGSLEDLKLKAEKFVKKLETQSHGIQKVIYISHPYQGNEHNKSEIQKIITDLVKKFPGYLFLSPVHAFGFLYNEIPYSTGLAHCIWLLDKADEMWVFGDYQNSIGCKVEIRYCEKNNIPLKIIRSNYECNQKKQKRSKI